MLEGRAHWDFHKSLEAWCTKLFIQKYTLLNHLAVASQHQSCLGSLGR